MGTAVAGLVALAGTLALRYGEVWLGWPMLLAAVVWAVRMGPGADDTSPVHAGRVTRPEIIAILALTLFGGALRIAALDTLPPGCWFDEAENGLETLRLLSGDFFIFTPHNNGRGAVQFFWTAPFFLVFGSTSWALRLAIATVGTATIPAVWLLFRRVAGAEWGVFGAALLAFSLWHLHVSRIAFDVAFTPLFDILAIYATINACASGSMLWYACAGALCGVANYAYQASRVTPLIVGAFLALRPESGAWRSRRMRGPVLVVASFALVMLPLAAYAVTHSREFVQRSRQVNVFREALAVGSPAPVVASLNATVRMFHERGDENARHHNPGLPMLDPVTGALFALGLVWGRRIAGRQLFLATVAWLILPLVFGGVLTVMAPHANRTAAAIPTVCLIATWGARGLLDGLRLARRGRHIVAALMVLAVATTNATSYFLEYPAVPGLPKLFSAGGTDVGEFIAQIPAATTVRVVGYNESVVRFVSGRVGTNLEVIPDQEFGRAIAEPGIVIVPDASVHADALRQVPHLVRSETGRFGGRFDVIERLPR